MRKIQTLLIGILLVHSMVLTAMEWTPDNLPMVHLQDARRYVCNPDGVMSQAAVNSADVLLANLERDKGIETVVIVVNHLKGDDPYEFGMQLARKYGVGSKKQNSGLIVILAVGDRSYQILTGNGLEGTLPDAICRRIQNQVMVPRLKQGDWEGAIVNTLRSIDGYVRQDPELTAELEGESDEKIMIFLAVAVWIGLMLIFLAIYLHNHPKCPKCKKRMTNASSELIVINGVRKIAKTFRCPHCGHKIVRHEDDPNSGVSRGGGIPPIFIGGGRSSGGGFGGFGGGSFGGGSFGGGGSGGRF